MDERPDPLRDQVQDQLHDPLQELMREGRYIPDDGFTGRTLQRLPGPRPVWRRWVLGTAVLLSVLTAAALSADVVALAAQLWQATASATAALSGAWTFMAVALVIAVGAALAVLRDEAW